MEGATATVTPTASERPATFEAAFAADTATATDSQAVTPSTPDPSASTTVTPGADVTPTSGPIPFDRHKAILDGAYKERDDAKTQFEAFKQQYGWAESVDRQAIDQAVRAGQMYQRDRVGYIRELLTDALSDPSVSPAIRSEAARILGARQTAPADLSPDIPVLDQQGQVVAQAFSAERVKALIQHGIAEALQREVAPLKTSVEQVDAERRALAQKAQASEAAQTKFAEAQKWDGFTEHQAAIADAFAQHPEWSLEQAYISVVPMKLRQSVASQTLDSLKTKAQASTPPPASAPGTSPGRPKSFHDPSLSWK